MGTFADMKMALIIQFFHSLSELMLWLQTHGDIHGVKKKKKKKKRKQRARTKNLPINLKVTRKRKAL